MRRVGLVTSVMPYSSANSRWMAISCVRHRRRLYLGIPTFQPHCAPWDRVAPETSDLRRSMPRLRLQHRRNLYPASTAPPDPSLHRGQDEPERVCPQEDDRRDDEKDDVRLIPSEEVARLWWLTKSGSYYGIDQLAFLSTVVQPA